MAVMSSNFRFDEQKTITWDWPCPPKIITHKNPDLDAIGFVYLASSFGKAFLLKKRFVIAPKREQKTI
jgi:hypothetical protein